MDDLSRWLEQFDPLPLECDGLTRVISTLLQREGIEHHICIGQLDVAGVGATPLHWWIALPDGRICDLRARMWLAGSSEAPHGAFIQEPHQNYIEKARPPVQDYRLDPIIFMILAEKPMEQFALVGMPTKRPSSPGL